MSSKRQFGPIIFGISWIIGVVSYLMFGGAWKVFTPNHEDRGGSSYLFNKIFSSFLDNENLPFRPQVYLTREPGVHTAKSLGESESIMFIPWDSSGLVLDGSEPSTIPAGLTRLAGFEKLSHDAKTILAICFHKRMSASAPRGISTMGSAMSLLWKAMGVHPFPDKRWIKYKGLFRLDPLVKTGIDEIDEFLTSSSETINDSQSFMRTHNLHRMYRMTEADLKWAYIFLRSFGVTMSDGRFLLVAPLVFARRSPSGGSNILISTSDDGINIQASTRLDRTTELIIDSSSYYSDAFAYVYQGSWIAQDSIHRGYIFLGDEVGADRRVINFSNDPDEQVVNRKKVIGRMAQLNAIVPTLPAWLVTQQLSESLKQKLNLMVKHPPGDPEIAKLKLVYINFLINEIIHFEKETVMLKKSVVDV